MKRLWDLSELSSTPSGALLQYRRAKTKEEKTETARNTRKPCARGALPLSFRSRRARPARGALARESGEPRPPSGAPARHSPPPAGTASRGPEQQRSTLTFHAPIC
eukprot:4980374-Prymnesium_polylepis.2